MTDIEKKLVQDIKEFVQLFRRPPTPDEVIAWAEDIYHHNKGYYKARWAKRLIESAI